MVVLRAAPLQLPTVGVGRSYHRWTPAQVAILREHFFTQPLGELARRCGHTAGATRNKAKRLGLHVCTIGDAYTINDLALNLRVSHRRIVGWIDAGWLTAERPAASSHRRITAEDLRTFILRHPLELADAQPFVPWLLAILAPRAAADDESWEDVEAWSPSVRTMTPRQRAAVAHWPRI